MTLIIIIWLSGRSEACRVSNSSLGKIQLVIN